MATIMTKIGAEIVLLDTKNLKDEGLLSEYKRWAATYNPKSQIKPRCDGCTRECVKCNPPVTVKCDECVAICLKCEKSVSEKFPNKCKLPKPRSDLFDDDEYLGPNYKAAERP